MRVVIHAPQLPDLQEGFGPRERRRLADVCRRAQARAVAEVARHGIMVELIDAPGRAGQRPIAAPPLALRNAQERVAENRYGRSTGAEGLDAPSYDVPSYDDEGAPVQIPLADMDAAIVLPADEVVRGSSYPIAGDELVLAPFGPLTVLKLSVTDYRSAESARYARTASLQRAKQWGEVLFGTAGYVILTPNGNARRFIVAGLDAALQSGDIPNLAADTAALKRGRLIDPQGYDTVVVLTSDGIALTRINQSGYWNAEAVAAALSRPWQSLRQEDFALAGQIITGGTRGDRLEETADAIALMDAELFRAIPWTERVRYIELLSRAGMNGPRRTAVIAILSSCNAVSELDAMIGPLRADGVYEELFADLDEQIFALLQALGAFAPPVSLNADYLITLFLDQLGLKVPSRDSDEAPNALDEAALAVEGVTGWIIGTLKSIWFMLSRPDKVVEGLVHLVGLLWTMEKARYGDAAARAELDTLARAAGHAIAQAIRGMELAEDLGRSFAGRGGHSRVGHDILGRLRYAMAAEVLSWTIGIGEVKAAAIALPKAFGLLSTLIGAVLAGGKLASEAQKLERVLAMFARLSRFTEVARLARVLEMLPATELARLQRIVARSNAARLATVELSAVRTLADLHGALGSGVTLAQVRRLHQVIEAAERMEAKALAAGLARETVLPAFHALIEHLPWRGDQLARIVEAIPPERLAEFLHAVSFVRPDHFATLGVDFFRLVAGHPETLALVTEAGSGVVVALHRQLGSFHLLDDLAKQLARHRAGLGDPVAYRHFLDRIVAGDSRALAQLAPEHLYSPEDIAAWERVFQQGTGGKAGTDAAHAAASATHAGVQFGLKAIVEDAIIELHRALGGIEPRSAEFGTRVHAIFARRVREAGLPAGYRLLSETPLAQITSLPPGVADMTLAEFLSRAPHIERAAKAPSSLLLTKVGDLRPDLLLLEPAGNAVLWDLTARNVGEHVAKTNLYLSLLNEFGVARGHTQIGETYWRIIREDLRGASRL